MSDVIVRENAVVTFNAEQIDVLRNTVARGTSDAELQLFLQICERTQLDPFSKQIHAVMLFDKKLNRKAMTIITAIDGYRAIAERSKEYAGNEDYLFNEGLTQYQCIQNGILNPTTATATVKRLIANNFVSFTATVVWNEYCPPSPKDYMWKKMPFNQCGKCAEALALRKAFPSDLSGLYIREEMEKYRAENIEYQEIDTETGEITEIQKRQIATQQSKRNASPVIKRPYEPEYLKEQMSKSIIKHGKTNPVRDDKLLTKYHAAFSALKLKNEDKKIVQKYLFDVETSNDLIAAQMIAAISWIDSKPENTDEGEIWIPNLNTVKEVDLILELENENNDL